MSDWNPFDPLPPMDLDAVMARRRQMNATAGALSGPGAEDWLRARIAQEPPSYRPGYDFATTAFHEGRKAVLWELLHELREAHTNPTPEG